MSLLRPCQRALLRPVARNALAGVRFVSTEEKVPTTTGQPLADVVPGAPTKDVVAAELISGAPREY